jgi:hypothetical protein
MDYPNAKFLIYNCWEKDTPYKVSGSILLDCVITEDEAKEKIEIYKSHHDDFEAKFSSSTRTRFIYIVNQPELWSDRRMKVNSLQAPVEHLPSASQTQDEV